MIFKMGVNKISQLSASRFFFHQHKSLIPKASMLFNRYVSTGSKPKAIAYYQESLIREGSDDRSLINRAFGLLATSRWLLKDEACELLTEVKDREKYKQAIACCFEKIEHIKIDNNSAKDNGHACFHYIDKNGDDFEFSDEKLGCDEVEESISMLYETPNEGLKP